MAWFFLWRGVSFGAVCSQAIQTAQLYPALTSFVVKNILVRLVQRGIWADKTIWDGFVRCCVALQPASFPVVLQLPKAQLEEMLALPIAEAMRQPLLKFLTHDLPPAQRARWRLVVMTLSKPATPAGTAPASATAAAPAPAAGPELLKIEAIKAETPPPPAPAPSAL